MKIELARRHRTRKQVNTLRLQAPLVASWIMLAAGPSASPAQQYEVTDLGASGESNQPWSVNSMGQVAGYSRLSDGHGGYHDWIEFLAELPKAFPDTEVHSFDLAGDPADPSDRTDFHITLTWYALAEKETATP